MAIDKTKDIKVGGTLHSIATGNIIAHADEIMDENWGKNQSAINLEIKENITNIADEEDLTLTSENKLQLKDRDSSNGMGYKILRLPEDGILTQEMINEPNTIYEIRYDFNLDGKRITIPENCTLKFEGGKIDNGELIGSNTPIFSSSAIGMNITLSGIYSACEVFVIDNQFWNISSSDCTPNLNKAVLYAHSLGYTKVRFQLGRYEVNDEIEIDKNFRSCIKLYSNTEYDLNGATFIQSKSTFKNTATFLLFKNSNTIVKNGTLVGNKVLYDDTSISEQRFGIQVVGGSHNYLKDLTICDYTGDCIIVLGTSALENFNPNTGAKYTTIEGCCLYGSMRLGISVCNSFGCVIKNCDIYDIGGLAPGAAIDLEPWNETFIAEVVQNTTIVGCSIKNNARGIIVANAYVNKTFIAGCTFLNPDLEEVPTYSSDLKEGIRGTLAPPTLKETLNNLYEVDVQYDFPDTRVEDCLFLNSSVISCPAVSHCHFYGKYNAIAGSTRNAEAPCYFRHCSFENSTIFGGSLLNCIGCQFDTIFRGYAGIWDSYIITNNAGHLDTYNTTIDNCLKFLGGTHKYSNINFRKENNDLASYCSAVFIGCNLSFDNKKFSTGSSYESTFINNIITVLGPFLAGSKKATFISNTIVLEGDTYSLQALVTGLKVIATNNLIQNLSSSSQKVTIFGSGELYNNSYLGNLINNDSYHNIGSTESRPIGIGDGYWYFDTSLRRPIYKVESEWVDPVMEITSWKIIR